MNNILERINSEDEVDKKREIFGGFFNLIFVIIIIITLLFSAGMFADYTRSKYLDTVYLNDGSSYSSNNHKIIINDGYSVIIDEKEYDWEWVDHIQLHQKKGENE